MNRKLHNTILAFSVTGVMLFVGLVVAEPVTTLAPSSQPGRIATTMLESSEGHTHEAASARIESRARDFEARIEATADKGEAAALVIGFLAATITEAALTAALDDMAHDLAAVEDIAGSADVQRDPQPHASRRASNSRDLIAVPYFSFARGSRGSRS